MPAFAILRTAKLKNASQISGSARHTHRELPTPNANPARKQANEYGPAKSANEVVTAVNARLPPKRRKDAVLAIEYLVTASPEWFTGKGTSAGSTYFQDALRWLAQRHGTSNVVAWAVHRDESTPHLVCYVVPLDPETGRLNAKRWLGGSHRLSRTQTKFWEAVARRLGLERGIEGSRATHQRIKQWYGQITRPDPVVILSPEDVQRRSGESLPMLALGKGQQDSPRPLLETQHIPAADIPEQKTKVAQAMVHWPRCSTALFHLISESALSPSQYESAPTTRQASQLSISRPNPKPGRHPSV